MRRLSHNLNRRRDFLNLFLLRRHDSLQRRIANLADARLNCQQCGLWHRVPLIPTAFQFALDAQLFASRINLNNNRGVRQPKNLGEDHTCLTITVIVGLKAGHNQVGLFVADGLSQNAGGSKR